MTAPAIVMLCVSILILWGGLISAIILLTRVKPPESAEPEGVNEQLSQRDL